MKLTCDFTSRVVLVTVAAQGISKAIDEYFRATGSRFVATGRNAAELTKTWGTPQRP